MPLCIFLEDIEVEMGRQTPTEAMIIYNTGLATKKDELKHSMRHYWPIKSEQAMTDGIAMKGKGIKIPILLQKQVLQQLHSNYMGIEKMRLLA